MSIRPPAPPPPPPPALSANTAKPEVLHTELKPGDQVRKLTQQMRERCGLDSGLVVSTYMHVEPQLQDGPMCGLVALAMASKITGHGENTQLEAIVAEAKARGYTKQGEMFSAEAMADLARQCLQRDAAVIKGNHTQLAGHLVDHLRMGNLLLVPYDADGNHEPCLKKGHKAHWALLIGCALWCEDDDPVAASIRDKGLRDEDLDWLYHIPPSRVSRDDVANIYASTSSANHPPTLAIYVYAKQGKSRHTALWSLDSLLSSNANLKEPDPKIAGDPDNWILPSAGITAGLCNQMIFIVMD